MFWYTFFERNQEILNYYDEMKSEMEELIKNGTNLNVKDEWNKTPLHYASFKGYLDIVRILINNRVDVDVVDEWGRTPLHYASMKGYLDIVKILIESGADAGIIDECGKNPLRLAFEEHHLEVMKILIEHEYKCIFELFCVTVEQS